MPELIDTFGITIDTLYIAFSLDKYLDDCASPLFGHRFTEISPYFIAAATLLLGIGLSVARYKVLHEEGKEPEKQENVVRDKRDLYSGLKNGRHAIINIACCVLGSTLHSAGIEIAGILLGVIAVGIAHYRSKEKQNHKETPAADFAWHAIDGIYQVGNIYLLVDFMHLLLGGALPSFADGSALIGLIAAYAIYTPLMVVIRTFDSKESGLNKAIDSIREAINTSKNSLYACLLLYTGAVAPLYALAAHGHTLPAALTAGLHSQITLATGLLIAVILFSHACYKKHSEKNGTAAETQAAPGQSHEINYKNIGLG
jgi:hypothetical protein